MHSARALTRTGWTNPWSASCCTPTSTSPTSPSTSAGSRPPSPTPAASTGSAASPARSGATSSPASPSRTPRAPPSSPPAGARSGASPRPSSLKTPTSSPKAIAGPSRRPTRRPSPPPYPASLRRTRGPSNASTSSAVCTNMNSYRPQLARWLQLLAAKGVQDLVLVNRPWPRDLQLPATVFAITTLTRLYLGVWKLPDAAVLRGASFPHLRELGLCCVQMEHGDVDSLVARSPALQNLNILACLEGLRLRLVSQSLRCVQIVSSMMDNIAVVKAPCLERLILYASCTPSGLCTRVRIGDAPKLHAFGYLQPGPSQVLEIRDTVIMPGIKMSTNTMLTSVKVLSLNVRFGVRDDVMMVPPFLRCFPNAERLHIMSTKRDQPAGSKLTPRFWEDSGPIENVISRIHTMSIREFRGEPGEAAFLEYFSRSARVVRTVVVVMANPSLAPFSTDEAYSKVEKCCKNMASTSCRMLVIWSNDHVGGHLWRFKDGADFSFHDPFSIAEVSSA